jgi:DNA-binding SARP family transcriptional activator
MPLPLCGPIIAKMIGSTTCLAGCIGGWAVGIGAMHKESLSFRVLGPVGVCVGGSTAPIAARRQKALLAQLLLHPNATRSAASLIEGIYGDAPPQHPAAALQIVVCRLRRALDTFATRLVHDHSGYRIEVASDELDLALAQSYFARGMRARRDGEMASASTAFDAALGCWTGDALDDLSDFPFYDAHARCLREFQLEIVERRNEAYLRCGRQLELLRDIEAWVAMGPWRERLRSHQMIALYCAGRQIEALAVYKDLRDLLVSDFGVEPSREVQQLHGKILRQEPELLATIADLQALYEPSGPTRADFAHNPSDAASLIRRLRQIADDSDIVVVDGGPGINKTWLVVEVSGRVPDSGSDLTDDTGNGLRRVTLADSLDAIRNRLSNGTVDGNEHLVSSRAHA